MRNLLLLAVILAALLLISCGGSESAQNPPGASPSPAATIDAKSLFEVNCAVCHGPARKETQVAPPLTPERLEPRDDVEVKKIIVEGVPGTVMKSFQGILNDRDIDALVRFLKHTTP